MIAGLLGKFLHQMIRPSKISFKPTGNMFQKTSSNNTKNVTIAIPFMIKRNTNDPCEIKVHHSKGPAYIAKRNQMRPLTQLGRSFINGGQIIGLTLILTVISGVFMWILVSGWRISSGSAKIYTNLPRNRLIFVLLLVDWFKGIKFGNSISR